jgi:hypothetical protein
MDQAQTADLMAHGFGASHVPGCSPGWFHGLPSLERPCPSLGCQVLIVGCSTHAALRQAGINRSRNCKVWLEILILRMDGFFCWIYAVYACRPGHGTLCRWHSHRLLGVAGRQAEQLWQFCLAVLCTMCIRAAGQPVAGCGAVLSWRLKQRKIAKAEGLPHEPARPMQPHSLHLLEYRLQQHGGQHQHEHHWTTLQAYLSRVLITKQGQNESVAPVSRRRHLRKLLHHRSYQSTSCWRLRDISKCCTQARPQG